VIALVRVAAQSDGRSGRRVESGMGQPVEDAFSLHFKAEDTCTTRLPLTHCAPRFCVVLDHGRSA
jgi:hypothetical protein